MTQPTEDYVAGDAGGQGMSMSSTSRSARHTPGVPCARSRKNPVHRQDVLAKERALAPTLFHATEHEQRELARALGVEHHLPDPQPDLLASSSS